jgi:hypothetical protein
MQPVELWTPQGSSLVSSNIGGNNAETGESITIHTFHFHDKESGRRSVVKIPADSTVSQSHIEDMAAQAFENWLLEVKLKGKVNKPTPSQRREVGKAIREFREYAAKRRESTNEKIYYKGTNV